MVVFRGGTHACLGAAGRLALQCRFKPEERGSQKRRILSMCRSTNRGIPVTLHPAIEYSRSFVAFTSLSLRIICRLFTQLALVRTLTLVSTQSQIVVDACCLPPWNSSLIFLPPPPPLLPALRVTLFQGTSRILSILKVRRVELTSTPGLSKSSHGWSMKPLLLVHSDCVEGGPRNYTLPLPSPLVEEWRRCWESLGNLFYSTSGKELRERGSLFFR